MITIFKTMIAANESQGWRRWSLGVGASAAVLAVGLIALGSARGQVTPLQVVPLAQGSTEDRMPNLHVVGSTDVLQAQLIFQAGAETGWHIHPGPVVVVVKSGSLVETHANGCTTEHPTGSVFFETPGEVHNATNRTAGVTEVLATFISPEGGMPLIPVQNPGHFCKNPNK